MYKLGVFVLFGLVVIVFGNSDVTSCPSKYLLFFFLFSKAEILVGPDNNRN